MTKRFAHFYARAAEWLIGLSIPDAVRERQQPCLLFTCHDVDRGLQRDGAFFSPILAPISEYYARRGKQIVNLSYPLTLYRSRRVHGGAISLNRAILRGLVLERVEALRVGKAQAQARRKARRVALYRDLLVKLKVERVFSIQPPHELCSAAHELGIPVIEAMHGMNLHPSDRLFHDIFEDVDDRLLPSIYLAFDARTQATLSGLLQGRRIRAIHLPHPWHVEVHRDQSRLRADASALEALLQRHRAAILVTLQWGYAGERATLANIIPNGIMHPALEQAISSSPKDVLWLLRLHPVQIKRRKYGSHRAFVRELARRHPNVDTTLASSLPLPLLLSRSNGHITMISGATGEAGLLGVPSLVLCPTLKPGGVHAGWFSELIEIGMVTLGELDAGEIARWVGARVERSTKSHRDWQQDTSELERRLDELLELRPES